MVASRSVKSGHGGRSDRTRRDAGAQHPAACSSRMCRRSCASSVLPTLFPGPRGSFATVCASTISAAWSRSARLAVGYGDHERRAQREAHLLNICVAEAYRCRGIGAAAAAAPAAGGRARGRRGSVPRGASLEPLRASVCISRSDSRRSACAAATTRPSAAAKMPSCSSAPSIRIARLAASLTSHSHDTLEQEIARRRTFAIISHPDAGKTTLTEKLLLFGGAIAMAGTVKGRKAARHATSDWMRLEQQRGISVTSSVMQFPYRRATSSTCSIRRGTRISPRTPIAL